MPNFGLQLLCFFFLTAPVLCAGDEKKDLPEKALPEYYPLQVGNQWTYKVKSMGLDSTMVSRIAKIETIKDQPYARLEAVIGGRVTATEHLRETDKGIIRLRTNDFEADPPLLLLKYPIKLGDKWGEVFTVKDQKWKYNSENHGEETVEVPAGKFKALRVGILLQEDERLIHTTYWLPAALVL